MVNMKKVVVASLLSIDQADFPVSVAGQCSSNGDFTVNDDVVRGALARMNSLVGGLDHSFNAAISGKKELDGCESGLKTSARSGIGEGALLLNDSLSDQSKEKELCLGNADVIVDSASPSNQVVIATRIIGPLADLLQNVEFDINKEVAWAILMLPFGASHEIKLSQYA